METTIITGILSLILTLVSYPTIIKFMHRLKFGQSIREEGPKSHHQKKGTPTMGGVGFVIIPMITMLLVNYRLIFNMQFLLIALVYLGYFLIGFLDDYLIVVQKKNDGLKARYKLLAQFLIVSIFILIYNTNINTTLILPFITINLHFIYYIFIIIMFVAESNAVNLTDGIDGLCASVTMVALIPFAIISYYKQEWVILTFIVALFFSLLGYYQFNKNPAKIFMGDTGSLALGGVLALIATLLKVEILLIVIGGVYLIETLSVMIQVAYYKRTKKRIFLMSPIHHHYELKGLNEKQIVRLFTTAGVICALLGVMLWYWM